MTFDLKALRAVAEAADQASRPDGGSRPWLLRPSENPEHPGYPQTILREGDVILVGECFDGTGPEGPWPFAEHITTFDPPTALALLDHIEALEARHPVPMNSEDVAAAIPEDPRFDAAIDMVRRTGCTQFQMRWSDDEIPTVWMAVAGHRIEGGVPTPGEPNRWSVAAGLNPLAAVFRLLDQLVDGGTCSHCHRPSGFTEDFDPMPLNGLVCWFQFDPELAIYRRGCE